MSVYYQDDQVTLFHADCRDEDAWLAADVLVTDPPYGRNWKQGELRGHARNVSSSGIRNDTDTSARDAALEAWGLNRPAVVFGDLMLPPLRGQSWRASTGKPTARPGFVALSAVCDGTRRRST